MSGEKKPGGVGTGGGQTNKSLWFKEVKMEISWRGKVRGVKTRRGVPGV